MDDRLKQIIFKQLYRELGDCEMIPYKDSIWFIDREKEYWYFEFDKSGTLWWRYHFFTSYFKIFSMSSDDFTPILSSVFCNSLKYLRLSDKSNSTINEFFTAVFMK